MSSTVKWPTFLSRALALFGAVSLATIAAAAPPCAGPGAPTTTQTQCVTAILIPGNPLQSFDISFVNPQRAEYPYNDTCP
jgi:hypothetical protein